MAIQNGLDLIFGKYNPGQIGVLKLDAMLSERQSYANDVTQFPIETGGNITDHVIQKPEELTITGFVSNTPVQYLNMLQQKLQEKKDYNQYTRVNTAYLELLRIAGYKAPGKIFQRKFFQYDEKTISSTFLPKFQLVDIVTGLRVYNDMAMTSLEIPRDAETGDAIEFTATFRKATFVDLKKVKRTVQAKTSAAGKKASNKNKGGNQPTAPAPEKLQSVAAKAARALTGK